MNRAFLPAGEARVSVQDGGWLHGAGLFETMRAEAGRVFRLESHIGRLRKSAEKLLRPIERDRLPSRVDFLDLLERNALKDARVRMTVSAGPVTHDDPEAFSPTVCVTATTLAPPAPKTYETGVQVALCDFRLAPGDPLAGHKTTAYLARLLGLRAAQRARCMEALWFTTGNLLAEGCVSNVFVVKDNVLKTPPLDTPVLPGIARASVLDLARENEIEALECPLTIDDLLDADEVFLTSAVIMVMPVVRVEKRDISAGRVGPVTARLLEGYRNLIRKECRHE
ncbi:MAG: aminotransferase class IV [Phycisphaerae bacterium]